ncbi:MAG TPA: sigma-70 family RNA polymerase sigma factor [Capsulimonadaceae bacterium]
MFVLECPVISPRLDSDNVLIQDCRAGNIDAYSLLVTRYRTGIYNFIRHTIGAETDAQDLSQEVFVNAYGALGRFRIGSPFEPWIYRIAANLCRSYFRQAKRRPASLDTDLRADMTEDTSSADPIRTTISHEDQRRIRAAIVALPEEQRMVVVLRHMRGQSYREISTVLGVPVTTVEHRLRAARHVLRSVLEDSN